MQIEITFENDIATFESIGAVKEENYWFAMLNPDIENQDSLVIKNPDRLVFSVKKSNTLPVLNLCVELLRACKSKGDLEHNRNSLLAFIDEAVTHREYCSEIMLFRFDYFLAYSMFSPRNIWDDKTHEDMLAYNKGRVGTATAGDIKEIHTTKHKETYLCHSTDVPIAMLVQVAYTLMFHLFKEGKIIKRCERCGSLFIPTRASDKYCQRKTNGKTCGEIRKAENQKKSHNTREQIMSKRIDTRLTQRGQLKERKQFRSGLKKCNSSADREAYLERWDKQTETSGTKKDGNLEPK